MEPLLETTAHVVPVLAERVPRDGLLWRNLDVMWKREPVVAPISAVSVTLHFSRVGATYVSSLYCVAHQWTLYVAEGCE